MKSLARKILGIPFRLVRWIALSTAGRNVLRNIRKLSQDAWHADQLAALKRCGQHVHLEYPVVIHNPECVELGSFVHLAEFVHFWGSGGITIGDRVMIGSHTAISSVTHDYTVEDMYESIVCKPVCIGNDVWIGTHALLLPGITVGDGAVIGAGAVVTCDVPAGMVVAGVPARLIRSRISAADLARVE